MNPAYLTPPQELALLERFMGAFIEELAHAGVRLANQGLESREEYP